MYAYSVVQSPRAPRPKARLLIYNYFMRNARLVLRIRNKTSKLYQNAREELGKIILNVKVSRHKKNEKKRGATRGLPRRSPILVLLSPKHA